MDTEERKQEIKRRLTLSKYPTRSKAQFTEENNHNPFVLASCPHCHGRGRYDTYLESSSGVVQTLHQCEACSGTGVSPEIELYFKNNNEPIPVAADADGWIKCPNCGRRFAITDKHAWTGLRHTRCGQILHVKKAK